MKYGLILLMTVTMVPALAQHKMLFLSFREVQPTDKSRWCADTEFEHTDVQTRSVYDTMRDNFLNDHKGWAPRTQFVSPEESVIVYEFERKMPGFNCNKKCYGHVLGRSMLDAEYQLKTMKTDPEIVTPYTAVFTSRGTIQQETIVEDYDGVIAKFITGKTASGKTPVVLQVKNTTKKLAVFSFTTTTANEPLLTTIELAPGTTVSRNIPMIPNQIDVNVGFAEYNQKEKPVDVIQYIKDCVGNSITTKGGKFKDAPIEKKIDCRGAPGKRG